MKKLLELVELTLWEGKPSIARELDLETVRDSLVGIGCDPRHLVVAPMVGRTKIQIVLKRP